MNILVVHNRYAFAGGEDEACATEVELLREHGHNVVVHTQDNRLIDSKSRWATGIRSVWSAADHAAVRRLISKNKLELMSVHNFFPLVSPSIYYAARAEGIPVVQTLHNYRLLCPAATFLRNGKICEDCLGKAVPWPALVHKCYRGSFAQTGAVAGMISGHKMLGTWRKLVNYYIALTPFMRNKFIAGGFPAKRIVVKPNSVEDTGVGSGHDDNFLFVGRLSEEKGAAVLLQAWKTTKTSRKLKIIGTGPDEMNLRAIAAPLPNVEFLGQVSAERVRAEMAAAAAVVFPSIWYEGLSRVVIEAFSKGTPILASDLGPISTIVTDGKTGVLFRVGDSVDLAAKLAAFPPPGPALDQLRRAAREEFERSYSNEVVYRILLGIFRSAIAPAPPAP
ncbi:MAG: glycosyltransferase family 4 protein [Terracidiphilus sp.]|jgi:glycosyltransferase involved in cell wall biosynthesis